MKDRFGNALTPLDQEADQNFKSGRISAEVIQTRCGRCGAWYETPRLETEFTETFVCDCGQKLSFSVPARESRSGILTPSNEEIIALQNSDFKLDTGMQVSEAIWRAALWWKTKGRRLMEYERLRQKEKPGSSDNGLGGAFASLDPDDPNFMPSGLINALEWDALSKREKIYVVKVWHHFFVRKPDLIGGANDDFMPQNRFTIQ